MVLVGNDLVTHKKIMTTLPTGGGNGGERSA